MIRVQDENLVHGLGQDRVRLVLLARNAKHHLQEVLGVREVIARINERLANGILVTPGGNGRHLCNQAMRGNFPLLLAGNVHLTVVEGGQSADHTTHDRHRVCITTETLEEVPHLVVEHGVVFDGVVELLVFLGAREFAVKEEVADFKVVRMFGQLLNRVAAVQENAVCSVDVGNGRFAGCCGYESGIVCENAFLD